MSVPIFTKSSQQSLRHHPYMTWHEAQQLEGVLPWIMLVTSINNVCLEHITIHLSDAEAFKEDVCCHF